MSNRPRDLRRRWLAAAFLLLGLLVCAGILYWQFGRLPRYRTLSYSELIQKLRASKDGSIQFTDVQVSHVEVRGVMHLTEEETDTVEKVPFRTARVGFERDPTLFTLLHDSPNASYKGVEDESALRTIGNLTLTLLMLVLVALAAVLVLRWMSGGGSPFGFARSRARLYAQKDVAVTFRDVAGIDEAVAELREVVDFLRHPDKYHALGGRIPKGVLLVGPPGTGKTLLARAVAGQASVPFFSLSGSDFVEMFVGVGAARVRDLFTQAESKAPCIVFIDELDALGKTRAATTIGGHDEREQTLNQLLVEMDGFDPNRGIIIMAATNRPETLDPALLRPGRFDRTVVVDRPDIGGREAILGVHVRSIKLGDDVDLRRIASLTPGTAGADLANLVNEAALMAARAGKTRVGMAEFEEAVERGAVGLERKSRIMTADEKRRVAYHEAGHAIVRVAMSATHQVHKISIIPRGVGALGYVLSRPEEDRYLYTQSELESEIRVCLGGTVAEEIVYREISNGATSDLEQASGIARRMVKQFGMSRLGRICYQEHGGPGFLGGGAAEGDRSYSEETAREIDLEVRQILEQATRQVYQLLESRRGLLEAIARRLIEKEVIDSRELREILDRHAAA